MKPPNELNVLDQHGGFTAVTLSPTHVKIVLDYNGEREATLADYQPTLIPAFVRWEKVWRECNTVWRPGKLLRKTTTGRLDAFNEGSFYQTNNNVTQAFYRVRGYRFRIAVWFDNSTGKRIA